MKKEPVLVIMAAGMGSRFGGLKQIEPVAGKDCVYCAVKGYGGKKPYYAQDAYSEHRNNHRSECISCTVNCSRKYFNRHIDYEERRKKAQDVHTFFVLCRFVCGGGG